MFDFPRQAGVSIPPAHKAMVTALNVNFEKRIYNELPCDVGFLELMVSLSSGPAETERIYFIVHNVFLNSQD